MLILKCLLLTVLFRKKIKVFLFKNFIKILNLVLYELISIYRYYIDNFFLNETLKIFKYNNKTVIKLRRVVR